MLFRCMPRTECQCYTASFPVGFDEDEDMPMLLDEEDDMPALPQAAPGAPGLDGAWGGLDADV